MQRRSQRVLPLLCSILVLGSVCAQGEKNATIQPAQGGESLLRRAWVRLRPEKGTSALVRFTYTARQHDSKRLTGFRRKFARWHPGGDSWPIFETTHPIQFEVGREGSTTRKRAQLPAGRFVLTIQNAGESSHLVLTDADAVRRARLMPTQVEKLARMGGYVLPADTYEAEFAIAHTAARLRCDEEGESGELDIHVGNRQWSVGFVARKHSNEPTREPRNERARVQRHLVRLGVPLALRRTLLEEPVLLEALTLDPNSREDGDGGDRFRGYRILGRKRLDAAKPAQRATATELQALLRASVLAHPDTTVEDCFFPRHALRFRSKTTVVDIVICFECSQGHAWVDGKAIDQTLYLKGYWEPRFSGVVRALGLRVAK